MSSTGSDLFYLLIEHLVRPSFQEQYPWVFGAVVPLCAALIGGLLAFAGVLYAEKRSERQSKSVAAALLVTKFNTNLDAIVSARRHIEEIFDKAPGGIVRNWWPHLEEFVGVRPVPESVGHAELKLLASVNEASLWSSLKDLENVYRTSYECFEKYNRFREELARLTAPFSETKIDEGVLVAHSAFDKRDIPYAPRLMHLCDQLIDKVYDMMIQNEENIESVRVRLVELLKKNSKEWDLPVTLVVSPQRAELEL